MTKNMSASELVENEIKYKAFLLDISGEITNLRKSIDLKTPGYFIKGEEVNNWYFKGFFYKDKSCIYGDYFEGRSLKEILDLPPSDSLPLILKMLEAVDILQVEADEEVRLQLDSVFFTEDGGILFLPFRIISEITSNSFDDYKVGNSGVINNPYITDPQAALSYSIASILYKVLTGVFPFEAPTEEELDRKYRNSRIAAPGAINFGLKKEFSEHIYRFLNDKSSRHKTEVWKDVVGKMLENGISEEISDEEKEKRKALSMKSKINIEKNFRKRFFLERNRALLTTIAVSGIITVIVLYNVIGIITRPRSTKGFAALQVVEAYYKSFNTLDDPTLRDCVEKGLAKEDSGEITYLFLFDKQTQAYEMKSYFIPADRWVSEGKQTISSPYIVYGISGLSINRDQTADIATAAEKIPEAVFSAVYEKWKTNLDVQGPGIREVNGKKIRERLHLRKTGGYWVIYKIERSEETEIN